MSMLIVGRHIISLILHNNNRTEGLGVPQNILGHGFIKGKYVAKS